MGNVKNKLIFAVVILIVLSSMLLFFVLVNAGIVDVSTVSILSLIFGIAGLVGTFGTIAGFIYARKAQKGYIDALGRNKNISWNDLNNAACELARIVNTSDFGADKTFKPDCMLAVNAKGAIVAEVARYMFCKEIPLFVGTSLEPKIAKSIFKDVETVKTYKWSTYIPEFVSKCNKQKILVVHDFSMSGQVMLAIKKHLINKYHFDKNNVKTYCIVTTRVSTTRKVPDKWWLKTDEIEFFFPWGKAK